MRRHLLNAAAALILMSSPALGQTGQDDFAGYVGFGIVAAAVLLIIIVKASKLSPEPKKLRRDRDGFLETAPVPHAGFKSTKKGFEVALRNKRGRNEGCLSLFKSRPTSRIKVTKDAIVINGKRLRPTEFGGFTEAHNQARNPDFFVGYAYGRQTHYLPGAWSPQEVSEIVSALNDQVQTFFQS